MLRSAGHALLTGAVSGMSAFSQETSTTEDFDGDSLALRHEMRFAWIPPGKKIKKDQNGDVIEIAQEEGFYCGVYEVTQDDWRRMMNEEFENVLLRQERESAPQIVRYLGESLPVYCLTTNDARAFLKRLNELERRKYGKNSWTYRLPSATEWEYAARSFDGQEYVTGDALLPDAGVFRFESIDPSSLVRRRLTNEWRSEGPAKVGATSIENVHGLHDIHGNVSELTASLSKERLEDMPGSILKGPLWITKGGGWMSPMTSCAFGASGITGEKSTNLPTGMRLLGTKPVVHGGRAGRNGSPSPSR